MGALWDRFWGAVKRGARRLMGGEHPIRSVVSTTREIVSPKREEVQQGPVFAPSDTKYTNALDRLSEGDWLSINVYGQTGQVRHDTKARILYVRFPVGRSYAYRNCGRDMAVGLLNRGASRVTPAGGTWVWDNLRIRGTRYGHQKPYREVTGMEERDEDREAQVGDFPGWSPTSYRGQESYRARHPWE